LPKSCATGALGKQIELLLFDTVLHIATLTIKLSGVAAKVGHHKTRVLTTLVVSRAAGRYLWPAR